MTETSRAGYSVVQRLGGGTLALARLCIIVPACFIAVYVTLGILMPSMMPIWSWLQRGVVIAGILGELCIFIKYPWHSLRPKGLTQALAVSFMIALPAAVSGFLPGIIGAFVTPALVVAFAGIERFRSV